MSRIDGVPVRRHSVRERMMREGHWVLYAMLVPSFLLLFVFKYVPMYGIIISFQDYDIFSGISGSEWVGLANFREAFHNPDFGRAFQNTLIINIYKLIFWIVLPITLAVMLNEVRTGLIKKVAQTIVYLPHFLSWVIVGGIFKNLLAVNDGLVNSLIKMSGAPPINFMYNTGWFIQVLLISAMWKEVGFGTVIYMGALSSIDPQLYEAARMDGASRLRQIRSITLPCLVPTMMINLIMGLGNLLGNSFEQIFVMYNPAVYRVADVLSTFVYRYGVGMMEYSLSTAMGLFNSVIGFILVLSSNAFVKKLSGRSLW